VGGIVPVVLQISSLPFFLLAASTVEIFCQNFLTGAVSAWLLGVDTTATKVTSPNESVLDGHVANI
jgi:hypothetical protein